MPGGKMPADGLNHSAVFSVSVPSEGSTAPPTHGGVRGLA
ncbi:MAG: hypothetical protein JWO22_3225, partial [Frankiales bacterium]|nr:hypothetical protein [Frankiales bacterium]